MTWKAVVAVSSTLIFIAALLDYALGWLWIERVQKRLALTAEQFFDESFISVFHQDLRQVLTWLENKFGKKIFSWKLIALSFVPTFTIGICALLYESYSRDVKIYLGPVVVLFYVALLSAVSVPISFWATRTLLRVAKATIASLTLVLFLDIWIAYSLMPIPFYGAMYVSYNVGLDQPIPLIDHISYSLVYWPFGLAANATSISSPSALANFATVIVSAFAAAFPSILHTCWLLVDGLRLLVFKYGYLGLSNIFLKLSGESYPLTKVGVGISALIAVVNLWV